MSAHVSGPSLHESLLDLVGGTPLVRLRRLADDAHARVYVKLEYLNPGGSVKDRAASAMVAAAEASGAIRPGGTLVEGTSGNTGVGLAQAAAVRGYRLVAVLPDIVAREKIDTLIAYGAEVVLTPANLPREHPDHVRNLAARIAEETPGGWLADQYDNPANPQVHVETTGVPDRIREVGDRDSILTARALARHEGILVGGSSGLAAAGALQVARELGPDALVVALLPDSGRNYLSKYHSPAWLHRFGFLDDDRPGALASAGIVGTVHTVAANVTAGEAAALLQSDARGAARTAGRAARP